MKHIDFKARAADIKARAYGRWRDILLTLGIEERYLRKKHGPCPMCSTDSTDDRFRFTDRRGNGDWICSPSGNGCGAGDGFKLLMSYHNWDFKMAINKVAEVVGSNEPLQVLKAVGQEGNSEKERARLQRIWDEASPIDAQSPAARYLKQRGFEIASYPRCLRFHPKLGYFRVNEKNESELVGEFPALVAKVQDADGTKSLGLQRYYLTPEGTKANVEKVKKAKGKILGGAIHLFPAAKEMCVGEGLENAYAGHSFLRMPAWSTVNTALMESLDLPEIVKSLHIVVDREEGFAGLKAAFTLAHHAANGHIRKQKREVHVHAIEWKNDHYRVCTFRSVDPKVDFNDLWLMRREQRKAA